MTPLPECQTVFEKQSMIELWSEGGYGRPMNDEVPESRRDRLRRELTDEIVETGRRQLEAGGVAAVSWRAIAREVGMNPASLYTYVDGVDDLFTRILLLSFDRLATAIRSAADAEPGAGPGARLLAAAHAYRGWALDHPREFNLLYTDQLPNYTAPPDGPTVDAALAVERPFLEAMGELAGLDDPFDLIGDEHPERAAAVYGLRATLHGFITLEVNHHAPYLNGAGEMMGQVLTRSIDEFTTRFGQP